MDIWMQGLVLHQKYILSQDTRKKIQKDENKDNLKG